MAENARILIIDDEEGMRDFLSFVLETEGYHPLTATGGQEALKLVEQDNIDAILTDLKMPGMDGIELLRRIREHDHNAIVVIMTAYASLQSALEAMKYGAYDYLLKPFDNIDTVMATVSRAVERRRLAARNTRLLDDLQRANLQLNQRYKDVQKRTVEIEKAYENLQALEGLRAQFMARVFRTQLDSLMHIEGHLTLLTGERLGPLSSEQREAIGAAEQRAEELIRLVNDILYLQEADAGQVQFSPQPVSLATVVEKACQSARARAGEQATVLDCDIPEDLPPILGNEARLQHAVIHLLDNAVKSSPPLSRVNVSLKREGKQVRLTIRDQGEGIPDDIMQRIFDHLYQVDSSRQRAAGLRLGLPVVKHIVDVHGGAIEIASREGKGTTVTLILPNVVQDDT
ncbi:MAG: response regulator [Chloroflexota bacterium]|nr:response regulator [Chloroflexota bacterium]